MGDFSALFRCLYQGAWQKDAKLSITIRPATEGDLESLERLLPSSRPTRHQVYLTLQQRDVLTYLIVWANERPIGSGAIRWAGPREATIAVELPQCPEVLGVGIVKAFQAMGIGTQLFGCFESLATNRGFAQVGLGVAVKNDRARSFYERRGYRDAGLGEYLDRWYRLDDEGKKVWVEERVTFLLKQLGC